MDKYIRFDWAAKRMLRDKANFGVLEGLITVLLNEPVHIEELLESESNQETDTDKFNRVDIKAKNSKGEIILVEIQLTRELYFMKRILYGVSKSITEHINLGESYEQVRKVYSISILYFDLGKGADYLYHGKTTFTGVHTGDTLQITTKEKNALEMKTPDDIFPEYFLIRLKEFNTDKEPQTPLEEWLDYLRSGHIKDDTTTPGLQQVRGQLRYVQLTPKEEQDYFNHLDAIMTQNDVIETCRLEGLQEGFAEGLEKGRAEGRAEGEEVGLKKGLMQAAQSMLASGMSKEEVTKILGIKQD